VDLYKRSIPQDFFLLLFFNKEMISTASSPTLSSPELSSGSSSLSDGELPVYRTHQSMKQMAEGRNLQKTISFVEINKREQSFSKKRDFGNVHTYISVINLSINASTIHLCSYLYGKRRQFFSCRSQRGWLYIW
jgi:hypothetical protein